MNYVKSKNIRVYLCSSVVLIILLSTLQIHASSLQDFTDTDSAILIVSTETGKILGSANADLFDTQYPPASLMKVFTAIAFYQDHGNKFPALHCPPSLASDPKGCWDRNGHGKVGIVEAIGYSCNVYFRQLAHRTSHEIFHQTLQKFDLPNSDRVDDIHSVMTGKTLDWTVSPLMLLRAYAALFNGGYLYSHGKQDAKHIALDEPVRKILYQGMKHASQHGTSLEAKKAAGQLMLGKTGTSLLWTDGKVNWRETQGYWIGLYPSEKPKFAVLTLVRKGRGATDAAPLGGKALSWFLKTQ